MKEPVKFEQFQHLVLASQRPSTIPNASMMRSTLELAREVMQLITEVVGVLLLGERIDALLMQHLIGKLFHLVVVLSASFHINPNAAMMTNLEDMEEELSKRKLVL